MYENYDISRLTAQETCRVFPLIYLSEQNRPQKVEQVTRCPARLMVCVDFWSKQCRHSLLFVKKECVQNCWHSVNFDILLLWIAIWSIFERVTVNNRDILSLHLFLNTKALLLGEQTWTPFYVCNTRLLHLFFCFVLFVFCLFVCLVFFSTLSVLFLLWTMVFS